MPAHHVNLRPRAGLKMVSGKENLREVLQVVHRDLKLDNVLLQGDASFTVSVFQSDSNHYPHPILQLKSHHCL